MNPAQRPSTPPNALRTQPWDVPQEAVYRLAKLKESHAKTVDAVAKAAIEQSIASLLAAYPRLNK